MRMRPNTYYNNPPPCRPPRRRRTTTPPWSPRFDPFPVWSDTTADPWYCEPSSSVWSDFRSTCSFGISWFANRRSISCNTHAVRRRSRRSSSNGQSTSRRSWTSSGGSPGRSNSCRVPAPFYGLQTRISERLYIYFGCCVMRINQLFPRLRGHVGGNLGL